jgi:hypothetical protein
LTSVPSMSREMKRIMGFSGEALSAPMGYYSFWRGEHL